MGLGLEEEEKEKEEEEEGYGVLGGLRAADAGAGACLLG
jgi:hypothetical protein